MSLYRNIHISMWGDAKFRSMSDDGKMLWIYFLTAPETTSVPGCIGIGKAGLAEALDWPVERLMKAFGEIEDRGMAEADWAARFVFLPNGTKYRPPDSSKNVTNWMKYLDVLPECDLKTKALRALWKHLVARGPTFEEPFRMRYPWLASEPRNAPPDAPSHGASDAPSHAPPDAGIGIGTGIGTGDPPPTPPASQGGGVAGDDPPPAGVVRLELRRAGAARERRKGRRARAPAVLEAEVQPVVEAIREATGIAYTDPRAWDRLRERLSEGGTVDDALAVVAGAVADRDRHWLDRGLPPGGLFSASVWARYVAVGRALMARRRAPELPLRGPPEVGKRDVFQCRGCGGYELATWDGERWAMDAHAGCDDPRPRTSLGPETLEAGVG